MISRRPLEEGQEPGLEGLEPPPSKYNNFTDLTRLREEVFLAMEYTGMYKQPDLMRGNRSKRK